MVYRFLPALKFHELINANGNKTHEKVKGQKLEIVIYFLKIVNQEFMNSSLY